MNPELSTARPDPASSWLKEAIASSLSELRLYVSTLSFALHPGRFVEAWMAGEGRRMNPLGFMATSLGVAAALSQLASLFVAPTDNSGKNSMLADLLHAFGPYLHYIALGMLCHAFLAALGSRKSLFGSVAIALYAGGAATLLTAVMLDAERVWAAAHQRTIEQLLANPTGKALLFATLALGLVVYAVPLGRALSEFHEVGRKRSAAAFVLAFIVTGFVFGTFNPPGNYGLHLELSVGRHDVTCRLGMDS